MSTGTLPHRRQSRVTDPGAAALDALSLTVLRRLDGLLSGDHAGLLPGSGLDRGDARAYVPGDDPRHIDWSVTARTTQTHVRDAVADHELELWLVVDGSSSLAFGTGLTDKYELAWAAAGAFALLAARGGNRVGALRASTTAPQRIEARSGRDHVGALLARLRTPPEDGDPGALAEALDQVGRLSRRRSVVVVVSDFLGPPDWEHPLRVLGRDHDLFAIEVSDRREIELPDVGLVAVIDPETGRRRLVDTSSAAIRDAYSATATARRDLLGDRLRRCGADHLELRTDRDWVVDLVRFVASRRSRAAARGR
jgi:uncharacterized protein (DUF58 family)